MRGAAQIGIPITLLQCALTGDHAHIGILDAVNNVAMCDAIYGADRIDAPWYDASRARTRVSAALSTWYFASDPATAALAPIVPTLHLGYTAAKPWLAPIKPVAVATLWTIAVYCVPLWKARASIDFLTAGWFCLSIAGLSHIADIVDIEEDKLNNVDTPAVLMGRDDAAYFAVTLTLASSWIHELSPARFAPYDIVSVSIALAFLCEDVALGAALATLVLAGYAVQHDVELIGYTIKTSGVAHDWATNSIVHAADEIRKLPEPTRAPVFDAVTGAIRIGDTLGGATLDAFHAAVKRRL